MADGESAVAGSAFAIRLAVPRITIITADGAPFTEDERKVIHEIFDVIRVAEETDARYHELEQRMLSMQRENLDLIVRNRTLSEVTSRDTLTGLYNRWYVIEKIDCEINRALRHGSPVSLLMLDIDHFKRVNDTYGHSAGDQVLQSVGKLLRESCRIYDIPGRYGGEEFCVVLPETKVGNTSVVAERIRQRFESTALSVPDGEITVTASIGIAGMESPTDDGILSPAALIDRADRALYSAKHRGRNRVELWDAGLYDARPEISH
ncbi:MAG TPA: GGDEF domain-containing protein [Thermoanaerobaculia bacterium]|nr:GGDEF domain-containing protein [Thermoanaerobaculia bacterium]